MERKNRFIEKDFFYILYFYFFIVYNRYTKTTIFELYGFYSTYTVTNIAIQLLVGNFFLFVYKIVNKNIDMLEENVNILSTILHTIISLRVVALRKSIQLVKLHKV